MVKEELAAGKGTPGGGGGCKKGRGSGGGGEERSSFSGRAGAYWVCGEVVGT